MNGVTAGKHLAERAESELIDMGLGPKCDQSEWGGTMGRNKQTPPRPRPTTQIKPQGEQQLSNAVWEQIVKAIRALNREAAAV